MITPEILELRDIINDLIAKVNKHEDYIQELKEAIMEIVNANK